LPRDIRVIEVESVADDFHRRFAATSKTYAGSGNEVADVFADETHTHVPNRSMPAGCAATPRWPDVTTSRSSPAGVPRRNGPSHRSTSSATACHRHHGHRRRLPALMVPHCRIEIGRGKMEVEAIWTAARWTALG
jgi:hypothetical protein